ncbi:MAG: ribulose-phosphate 3-epimerase, partial [Bacilli bacterium]|nr:ribulose-phosphate 3-epimerase [Bacilli bacterium]
MQISVSYLSSYYSNEKTVMMLESTSADYIHVDLMDGGFVDSKNFTTDNVLKLLKNHEKPLDIHLMTFDPLIYINDLAVLKPEYITFHLEATKDIVKTIELIKRNNIKVGISIKPATNILELMPYLALVDLVLLMSVEPGAGGQNFIYHIADKLKDLKKARTENNLNFKIAMDGGLNEDTIKLVKDLDIAVVGSYICKSNNYEERI